MPRREFSKSVKREALKRSGGKCEATGTRYGLPDGVRCNADLAYGLDFDHCIPDGLGGGNSLDQCIVTCRKCHRWKTSSIDVPQIAKMKRQRDKHQGIRTKTSRWPKRSFHSDHKPIVRDINEE